MEVMIRGYHEYKSIWLNPVIQPEELLCEQEYCMDIFTVLTGEVLFFYISAHPFA